MPRGGEDLVERLPEAERTVTNGDFRGDLQPTAFRLDEQFAPALRALAHADLEADQFLLAFRRRADQHQHAFAVVFHASLQEDAVRPHVHVPARRQIPLLPALVLALPLRRQSGDHRRREIRRILAQERRQRLLEVARRDAPQVEHRQKCVQALRAPGPQRQDRRREANPLAIAGRRAIPNLHSGDLDSADPRLDRPHRAVTVPHQAVAAVRKLQALHRGEKRLGFHLDSLRKQLPRTRSQDIRQWIVNLVGLTQWHNVAILVHGVSLSSRGSGRLDTRLDTPPISFRHHPVSRIALAAFREGLQKLGWVEGRNIRFEYRWGALDPELRQRFAKELVALRPELLFGIDTSTTAALLQQTSRIPIIFVNVSDPVGSGFVASFSRPGGNVTGFTNFEPTMAGKWLELLKEIAPHVKHVAFPFNPTTAPYAEYYLRSFTAAAATFAVEAIVAPVRDTSELESVIDAQAHIPNCGLVLMPDTFTIAHRARITSLAARNRLPAIYPYRIFTDQGGLLSYGNDPPDNYRRAVIYADRILKGTKPSELPVQAPVKFELVINLRTAKTLGLTVPDKLLAAADKVIE